MTRTNVTGNVVNVIAEGYDEFQKSLLTLMDDLVKRVSNSCHYKCFMIFRSEIGLTVRVKKKKPPNILSCYEIIKQFSMFTLLFRRRSLRSVKVFLGINILYFFFLHRRGGSTYTPNRPGSGGAVVLNLGALARYRQLRLLK